ncbi:hypothetical protein L1049_018948 [Liquidambar formosana]|uniref:RING-type E3 ubiquitin transferase n=1 Tax=Liquidambar formosana TaxID=63359 RepID=A0AAP0WMW6_LIQFO
MNQFSVPIIVLFFFFPAKAQETSLSRPHIFHQFRPSLATVIGVSIVVFCLTFLVLAYAKYCHTSPFNLFNHGTRHQNFHGLVRSRSRFSGIDKSVIDSIPVFTFSSLKGSKEGLECAVCLSKFEDAEILRLLPKCKHAFHMNCIDQWLESHSSCPLCRNKFDARDLMSFAYSKSSRISPNPSNLSEDPNVEISVQREQDRQGSSSFSIGSSFRKIDRAKKEELLIQEGNNSDVDRKLLHKFKHKIIVSDVVIKNRWSDANSSDLLFLNSEMLNVMSSKRFSSSNWSSGRFQAGFPVNDQIIKIKEDIERKRLYESKFSRITRSHSVSSTSSFPSTSNHDANLSRLMNPDDKRSMSEITNHSRFMEFSTKNRVRESPYTGNSGKEERMRRLWLPIARRTIQWFAGRERSSQQNENERHPSNV